MRVKVFFKRLCLLLLSILLFWMLPHSTPVNFEDKQKFISFKSAKDWRNSGKLIRNYAEIFKQFLTDRSDLSVAAKLAQIDKNLFTWILPTYDSTAALYDSFSGSGIVICVNDKYSAMGLATIRMIREIHHCDLPIEVFYMGASDLSLSNRKLFEDIKAVKVVDVETIFDKVFGG